MIEKLKRKYSELSKQDKKIADFCLNNEEEFLVLTIYELSEKLGVSVSTISRFTRKVFDLSYPQTKLILARNMDISIKEKETLSHSAVLDWNQTPFQMENTLKSKIQNLTQEIIDINPVKKLEEVANLINEAQNIFLFGIGSSGLVAQDFMQKLVKLGKRAIFTADSNLAILNSSLAGPSDLVIVFSYSGMTKEVLVPTGKAKSRNCKVVSITSSAKNILASLSDYVLIVPENEPMVIRLTSILPRYGEFFLIDLLFFIVAKQISQNPESLIDNYKDLLLELK